MIDDLSLAADPLRTLVGNHALRDRVTHDRWLQLRAMVMAGDQPSCEYCGDGGALELYEVWVPGADPGALLLLGPLPVCRLCYSVIHWREPLPSLPHSPIDGERLQAHFSRVNSCDARRYTTHLHDAEEGLESMRCLFWRLDYGEYASWTDGRAVYLASPSLSPRGPLGEDGNCQRLILHNS